MIIKSLSRRSNSSQLINYVLRYSLKENKSQRNKEHATLILAHNLRSNDTEGYIQEFKNNEAFRLHARKNSIMLFHTIISFSPLDKRQISIPILKDISKKFVELRGTNNLILAVAHNEKLHTHVHFVISGCKADGYSSRQSKQEFNNLKFELEKYQLDRYPHLEHSVINHEKSERKSPIQIIHNSRATIKNRLIEHLHSAKGQTKTQEDFFKRLSQHNYEPYYRNGKPQGILVDNLKFRFSTLGFKSQLFDFGDYCKEDALKEFKSIRAGQAMKKNRKILEDREIRSINPIVAIDRKTFERSYSRNNAEENMFDIPFQGGDWGIPQSAISNSGNVDQC